VTVVDRPPVVPEEAAGGRRVSVPGAVTVGSVGLVAVLVLALAVGGSGPSDVGAGLDQAGPLVDRGLPIARLATRIAALGVLGALLLEAVLRPARTGLPAARRPALRAASVWATAWAATTAMHALLTLAQLVGSTITLESVRIFVADTAAGRAALVVLAAAVLVALLARRSTTTAGAGLLLVVAAAGLVVPVVLTGHSAAADDHVLAVTNLSVHVLAASIWVGGLLALLVHGRGRDDLAPAAARFSAVALVCFLATGLSGLLAAGLALHGGTDGLSAAPGTGYGALLLAKTVALTALGAFGRHHRRRTLPLLRTGARRAFRRFAAVEAAVMLATVALAVALSSSPPPAAAGGPTPAVGAAPTAPEGQPAADPMAGHDHGELSVAVLIDGTRFHVAGPVDAGSRVTVHNATATEVTITAADGSFHVVVPGHALMTFAAPGEPGSYPFVSRHSSSFADALVVR
jgi:putative copper export protein